MKSALILLGFALLQLGCKKDEVDPSKLTSNPMDPANPGVAQFMEVEPVENFYNSLTQTYQHNIRVHVRTDLFTTPMDYTVSVTDLNGEVDEMFMLADEHWLFQNLALNPGQEYCYTISLRIGGTLMTTQAPCQTVPN